MSCNCSDEEELLRSHNFNLSTTIGVSICINIFFKIRMFINDKSQMSIFKKINMRRAFEKSHVNFFNLYYFCDSWGNTVGKPTENFHQNIRQVTKSNVKGLAVQMHIQITMNQNMLRQISSPWKLGVRLIDFVLLLVTYRKTRKMQ